MTDYMRYVGRKTMRKLQSRSNEHFTEAPDKDSFGRAMMERMGWSEGKGVGKNEDGMKTHIRAEKRGAEGLGADKGNAKFEGDNAKSCIEDGWYLKVFDKNKKKKKKKKSKSKKRKRDSSSDSDGEGEAESEKAGPPTIPTDAELFAATGGAMLGRRACPRYGEAGKHKRIADADAAFMAMFMNKKKDNGKADTAKDSPKSPTLKLVYGSEKFAAAAVQQSLSAKKRREKEAAEAATLKEEKRAKKRKKREEMGSFRWKQAIRQELSQAGANGMKEKKLRKSVVAAAMRAAKGAGEGGSSISKEDLEARFEAKLAKIQECKRQGKRVFLNRA